MLDAARWQPVLDVVREQLLTPVGPALAGPGPPRLQAAATTATCGPATPPTTRARSGRWLIGPFIDAWLKVHPDDRGERARASWRASTTHLGEACIGSISEVFDAEPPYTPRGCIAQAWSVAEVLRCWVKTAGVG